MTAIVSDDPKSSGSLDEKFAKLSLSNSRALSEPLGLNQNNSIYPKSPSPNNSNSNQDDPNNAQSPGGSSPSPTPSIDLNGTCACGLSPPCTPCSLSHRESIARISLLKIADTRESVIARAEIIINALQRRSELTRTSLAHAERELTIHHTAMRRLLTMVNTFSGCIEGLDKTRSQCAAVVASRGPAFASWSSPHQYHLLCLGHCLKLSHQASLWDVAQLLPGHLRVAALANLTSTRQRNISNQLIDAQNQIINQDKLLRKLTDKVDNLELEWQAINRLLSVAKERVGGEINRFRARKNRQQQSQQRRSTGTPSLSNQTNNNNTKIHPNGISSAANSPSLNSRLPIQMNTANNITNDSPVTSPAPSPSLHSRSAPNTMLQRYSSSATKPTALPSSFYNERDSVSSIASLTPSMSGQSSTSTSNNNSPSSSPKNTTSNLSDRTNSDVNPDDPNPSTSQGQLESVTEETLAAFIDRSESFTANENVDSPSSVSISTIDTQKNPINQKSNESSPPASAPSSLRTALFTSPNSLSVSSPDDNKTIPILEPPKSSPSPPGRINPNPFTNVHHSSAPSPSDTLYENAFVAWARFDRSASLPNSSSSNNPNLPFRPSSYSLSSTTTPRPSHHNIMANTGAKYASIKSKYFASLNLDKEKNKKAIDQADSPDNSNKTNNSPTNMNAADTGNNNNNNESSKPSRSGIFWFSSWLSKNTNSNNESESNNNSNNNTTQAPSQPTLPNYTINTFPKSAKALIAFYRDELTSPSPANTPRKTTSTTVIPALNGKINFSSPSNRRSTGNQTNTNNSPLPNQNERSSGSMSVNSQINNSSSSLSRLIPMMTSSILQDDCRDLSSIVEDIEHCNVQQQSAWEELESILDKRERAKMEARKNGIQSPNKANSPETVGSPLKDKDAASRTDEKEKQGFFQRLLGRSKS